MHKTVSNITQAFGALEQYGAEGPTLFAQIEGRLFDVENPDQEITALASTIQAWEDIENSESARILLPVLRNRLAELQMDKAPAQ